MVNVYRLLLSIAIESALIYPVTAVWFAIFLLYVYPRVAGYHVFLIVFLEKNVLLDVALNHLQYLHNPEVQLSETKQWILKIQIEMSIGSIDA